MDVSYPVAAGAAGVAEIAGVVEVSVAVTVATANLIQTRPRWVLMMRWEGNERR